MMCFSFVFMVKFLLWLQIKIKKYMSPKDFLQHMYIKQAFNAQFSYEGDYKFCILYILLIIKLRHSDRFKISIKHHKQGVRA